MTTTKDTANRSDDSIDQRLEQVGERFVEIKHEVAKQLETRAESLGALIKEHPFAAAGVALAIGYLAARILHR